MAVRQTGEANPAITGGAGTGGVEWLAGWSGWPVGVGGPGGYGRGRALATGCAMSKNFNRELPCRGFTFIGRKSVYLARNGEGPV